MAGTGFFKNVIKALGLSKPQVRLGVSTVESCALPLEKKLSTGTLKTFMATTKKDFGGDVVSSYQKLNIYNPTQNSNLGKIGVQEVRTMIEPGFKTQIMAKVNINGETKYLKHDQLKAYTNMMRSNVRDGRALTYHNVLRV